MTLLREQILAQIATTLAGTVQVGARIWRSRVEALSRAEAPAIIISPGTNQVSDPERGGRASMCKYDHGLPVGVAVYVRGNPVDQLTAPIEEDVHSRLMADRTLGGLSKDVAYLRTTFEMDDADATAGFAVAEYLVRYRTAVDDLGSG